MSRSRIFWFALIALTALVMACFYISTRQRGQWKAFAQESVAPFLKLSTWISTATSSVEWRSLNEAHEEIRRLREDNARMATELSILKDKFVENNRLREMLGFKQASPHDLLPCRVISRDPSTWWNTVLINRGWDSSDRLQPDLPVVSPRGLVGKTGEVSKSVTEVILLIDENCKISSVSEVNREQGIVVGEGLLNEGRPLMRMKFITRTGTLGTGERIFTSGVGPVFPPGLFIGTVLTVPELSASKNFGLYREAVIEPAVDPGQLDELFIILGEKNTSKP